MPVSNNIFPKSKGFFDTKPKDANSTTRFLFANSFHNGNAEWFTGCIKKHSHFNFAGEDVYAYFILNHNGVECKMSTGMAEEEIILLPAIHTMTVF